MYVIPNSADGSNQGRLCRIINAASGTLLDVAISKDTNVHIVIGSPEEVTVIHNWRVYPFGPGWVIEAIQSQTDAGGPRYLAPSGVDMRDRGTLTVSKFPTVWSLQRIPGTTYESDEFSRPKDMEEEWICVIRWPYGLGINNRVLDLENHGSKDPGTKVRFQAYSEPQQQACQHWRIQFVPSRSGSASQPTSTPPPYASGSRATPTTEAHTKIVTRVETTTVTYTDVTPPDGRATTKSYTAKTSTTSTAYLKSDGSVENDILPVQVST